MSERIVGVFVVCGATISLLMHEFCVRVRAGSEPVVLVRPHAVGRVALSLSAVV